jgi:hypothetical protein
MAGIIALFLENVHCLVLTPRTEYPVSEIERVSSLRCKRDAAPIRVGQFSTDIRQCLSSNSPKDGKRSSNRNMGFRSEH